MTHKKLHLPSKICPVCQRPFLWRKKWAEDWDRVLFLLQTMSKPEVRSSLLVLSRHLSSDA
ncbi:DUF2256 domain-containing protein [Pseudoalteromonas xiamenensis]